MMTWQVGFMEQALQGERIHLARIFWTATRQHIKVLPGVSANFLFSFLINFYRGVRLLTAIKRREFPMRTHTQEVEEVVSANEVNTDPEDEQITSRSRRT